MSQVLLVALGIYLAVCYGIGAYLVVRLLVTRTQVRPTSRQEPTALARAAKAELRGDYAAEQRIAA